MKTTKKVPHPDFALRFQQACDGNPDVPQPNYGRLGWFVTQMERFGVELTVETVRKWFAGESRPRPRNITYLAQILKVDEAWLSVGRIQEISDKQIRLRNSLAGGAVNVVAGLIQLSGGNPAFPAADDKRAQAEKIDLYAIIKGAQYAFHVTVADDGVFSIPVEARETVIIGVDLQDSFDVRIFELDWAEVEATGTRKGPVITVPLEHEWKRITSFTERL